MVYKKIIRKPYWKKRRTYKKTRKSYSRTTKSAFIPSIQMANLKPHTSRVRFQGKMKYLAQNTAGIANIKTILRVPCAFMGNPVTETGNWIAQATQNIIPPSDTNSWFPRYQHYKVMGSRITVTCKLFDPSQTLGQNNNMIALARVPDIQTFDTTVTNKSLEASAWVKTRSWGGFAGTGYKQARLTMGYSPSKQLNLTDTRDSNLLRTSTTYPGAVGENTYFNVILFGELDSLLDCHAQAIVDVKVDYMIEFSEPTQRNVPMAN